MLPTWLRLLTFNDRDVVFDERTGRHVVYPAGTAHQRLGSDQRLAVMLAAMDTSRLFLHRTCHPVFVPGRGALLLPDPAIHPAGGHPWRLFHVEHLALALWNAADGRRTLAQLAVALGHPVGAVVLAVRKLAKFDVQAVVARPDRLPPEHLALCRVVGPTRERYARSGEQTRASATDLGGFHERIADAATRFDHAETTLAHALALPHPAVGGGTFGARLASVLLRGVSARGGLSVVEVGGGTGELGAAFVAYSRGLGPKLAYLRIDRSPALLQAQSSLNTGTQGMIGDALALPVASATVDVLIANEVIADLPSERGPGGWQNTGAEQFIHECGRVLRPGGIAYLSEFGSIDDEPEETEQLDHPEVSIRFADLVLAAGRLGLETALSPVAEFLSLDLDARWLWRPHLAAVRALDVLNGRPLTAARAWTPDTLVTAEPVERLRWVTLRDEGPGPLPARMFVLTLRKR